MGWTHAEILPWPIHGKPLEELKHSEDPEIAIKIFRKTDLSVTDGNNQCHPSQTNKAKKFILKSHCS